MYLNDKSLEIQNGGSMRKIHKCRQAGQHQTRPREHVCRLGLCGWSLHWSLGCWYAYTGIVLVRWKEMVICGLLLHLSSGLLGSAQHPKGCGIKCHSPSPWVLFQNPLASAARHLGPHSLVLGSGMAVPRPFAAPDSALLASRNWGDDARTSLPPVSALTGWKCSLTSLKLCTERDR